MKGEEKREEANKQAIAKEKEDRKELQKLTLENEPKHMEPEPIIVKNDTAEEKKVADATSAKQEPEGHAGHHHHHDHHDSNETVSSASHDEHHHHEHHNKTDPAEDHSHHHHHMHKEHQELTNLTGAELDEHHKKFHVHQDHYEHKTSTEPTKIVAWFNATRRLPTKDSNAELLSKQIIDALKNGVHVQNSNGTTNLIVAFAGQGGVVNLNVDSSKNNVSGDAAIKVAVLTNSNNLGHHHHHGHDNKHGGEHKHDKDCSCEMCNKERKTKEVKSTTN